MSLLALPNPYCHPQAYSLGLVSGRSSASQDIKRNTNLTTKPKTKLQIYSLTFHVLIIQNGRFFQLQQINMNILLVCRKTIIEEVNFFIKKQAAIGASNDIIEEDRRILKVYMFIVQLYLFKKIPKVNIFFCFVLMGSCSSSSVVSIKFSPL